MTLLERIKNAFRRSAWPHEELAALALIRWAKREGVEMLGHLLSNKWRVVIGVVIGCLSLIDANDVLPVQYDDMLEGAIGIATMLGLGIKSSPTSPTSAKVEVVTRPATG